MKLLVSISLFIFLSLTRLSGQHGIAYTVDFQKTLDEYGLEMSRPAEMWLKLSPLQRDSFLSYDLVLEERTIEFRIIHYSDSISRSTPRIRMMRDLIDVASNQEGSRMYFQSLSEDAYANDWKWLVDFKPKKEFSDKNLAKMWTFHHNEKGMIMIIALYDEESHWDSNYLHLLKFKSEE